MLQINSKGQSFSLDLLAALIIFLIVLGFVVSNYSEALVSANNLNEKIVLQRKAFSAMELLTSTKGKPENWNELNFTDINSIGLLNSEKKASEEKLSAFINLDYTESKNLLGLNELDYFFSFTGEDSIESGLQLDANVQVDSVVLRRIVSYKGSEAVVELKVYKI
ncbi:MAG: hypothetical protein JW703_04080 [Candidatus Diapherotrites archaeon]|nr:hypothetical protein [Candidatus Diapherotrites archaeon]